MFPIITNFDVSTAYIYNMNLANQFCNNDSSNKELYELTDDQKRSIEISRSQIDEGQGIDHKDVINDLDQWLKDMPSEVTSHTVSNSKIE